MPFDFPDQQPPIETKSEVEEISVMEDYRKKDLDRKENLKDTLHSAIVIGIKVLAFSMLAIVVVRILFLVMPGCAVWVSQEQMDDIDTLIKYLATSAIGSFVFNYMKTNSEHSDK